MAETLQSVQQGPRGGGSPQFQLSSPVSSGVAGAVASVGGLASGLFQGAIKYGEQQAEDEADRFKSSVLGDLDSKLTNISIAAQEDPSINVFREQQRIKRQFDIDHPDLSTEGSELFKKNTGRFAGGLSPEQEAENKFINESVAVGWGRHGASREYNLGQAQLRAKHQRYVQDLKDETTFLENQLKQGAVDAATAKKKFLGGLGKLGGVQRQKFQASTDDLITRFKGQELTREEAMLEIQNLRVEAKDVVADLGEFSSDPNVKEMIAPITSRIDLAEKVVSGTIKIDAMEKELEIIRKTEEILIMSDPSIARWVSASKLAPNAVGLQQAVGEKMSNFLRRLDAEEKANLPNSFTLNKEEKGGVLHILKNMFKSEDKEDQEHAAETLSGAIKFWNKHNEEIDEDDDDFIITLLNNDDAVKSLSPAAKAEARDLLEDRIVGPVDIAMRENVLGVKVRQTAADLISGQKVEDRDLIDSATFEVKDGSLVWTVKEEFRGDMNVQREVRKANKFINEDIVPSIQAWQKYAGGTWEEAVEHLLPSATSLWKKSDKIVEQETKQKELEAEKAKPVDQELPASQAQTEVAPTLEVDNDDVIIGEALAEEEPIEEKDLRTPEGAPTTVDELLAERDRIANEEFTDQTKVEEFFTNIGVIAESDHGDTPQPTNDAKEANIAKDKRSKDVGYGHKVKPAEEESGMIHGIKFKDENGEYIPLTKDQKREILRKDMVSHLKEARKKWDGKLSKFKSSFDELDTKYQIALTSLAFNVGGAKAGNQWTQVLKAAVDRDPVQFARRLRRQEDGAYTKGMDNRVLKELYFAGIIKDVSEVAEVLPLGTWTP